jgi:tRNA(Arg) A34 adenosine deaminase TadA
MLGLDDADHEVFVREALREADAALRRGDLPIGAVVVHGTEVVGRGASTRKTSRCHIAHAELNALLSCSEYLGEHHGECIVYSTVEPCPMCLGAIVMADIHHVVFGAFDYRAGASHMVERVPYVAHHIKTYIGGVLEDDCVGLIRRYSPRDADIIQGKVNPFRRPPQSV